MFLLASATGHGTFITGIIVAEDKEYVSTSHHSLLSNLTALPADILTCMIFIHVELDRCSSRR